MISTLTGNAAAAALSLCLAPLAAHAADRIVPPFPPPDGPLRVVIDTDAACEIDDLYAIALALASRDRFEIEGFVGAHFGDAGGPEAIDRSRRSRRSWRRPV